jgi:hypothetical protein
MNIHYVPSVVVNKGPNEEAPLVLAWAYSEIFGQYLQMRKKRLLWTLATLVLLPAALAVWMVFTYKLHRIRPTVDWASKAYWSFWMVPVGKNTVLACDTRRLGEQISVIDYNRGAVQQEVAILDPSIFGFEKERNLLSCLSEFQRHARLTTVHQFQSCFLTNDEEVVRNLHQLQGVASAVTDSLPSLPMRESVLLEQETQGVVRFENLFASDIEFLREVKYQLGNAVQEAISIIQSQYPVNESSYSPIDPVTSSSRWILTMLNEQELEVAANQVFQQVKDELNKEVRLNVDTIVKEANNKASEVTAEYNVRIAQAKGTVALTVQQHERDLVDVKKQLDDRARFLGLTKRASQREGILEVMRRLTAKETETRIALERITIRIEAEESQLEQTREALKLQVSAGAKASIDVITKHIHDIDAELATLLTEIKGVKTDSVRPQLELQPRKITFDPINTKIVDFRKEAITKLGNEALEAVDKLIFELEQVHGALQPYILEDSSQARDLNLFIPGWYFRYRTPLDHGDGHYLVLGPCQHQMRGGRGPCNYTLSTSAFQDVTEHLESALEEGKGLHFLVTHSIFNNRQDFLAPVVSDILGMRRSQYLDSHLAKILTTDLRRPRASL